MPQTADHPADHPAKPLNLGLFALWSAHDAEDVALGAAELAARAEAALLVECVFDVRAAEVRVPTGYGPFVGVYSEDSRAAQEAEARVARFAQRLVAACEQRRPVTDAQAHVARPTAALASLAERADAVALSSADFHELCQWYRPRTPFHVVQEQHTPILVIDPSAGTVGESALVVDVETTVSDPVGPVQDVVQRLVPERAPISPEADPDTRATWLRVDRSAARAEHDTVIVHPTETLTLPLIGKHSRLRHAIDETSLAVLLV
jgi:hypothetical protein